ncbi:MAG: ATP synthase subunit I [Thermodesulfovibrio sp.]|nr:ATP synthase subunit I [Thermodesulfovibrio sp.]MCX7724904.1 ATP synthase subunit I [Thermodesulfovibrio sp.]MDW7972318.1 ATP synthase subunit I [Thermodesulfovibrio sp.]
MDKEVIKKINRQTFILVPFLAILSYLIWQNEIVAFNVILGGMISWLSLRELAWAVKKFFGKPFFQLTVIGLSYIKLGAIFLFLWFIAIKGWFNIKGLLIGFIAILIISTKEAYLYVRRQTS